MIKISEILTFIINIIKDFYELTDSIYPFDAGVSLFWIFASLSVTGILWNMLAKHSNFGDSDDED